MYQPTTRVLTVLELLQARGRMTGKELSERLEVDPRTVRRYITMLQDLGIPVTGERGRAGGYRIRPGFRLPPLMLSNDEAMAVTLGLLAVRRLGLAANAPAIEGALSKMERVLPPELRMRATLAHEALAIDVVGPDKTAAPGVVATLGEAALGGRRVWLRYGDVRGELTEREVDPYGLALVANHWYLAGHCHLRGAMRSFRLDRVREVTIRAGRFEPPPGFDPLSFVQRTLASAPGSIAVDVLLSASLAEARRHIPPSLAVLEQAESGTLMRCHVDDLGWLARELQRITLPFAVIRPDALRDELRRLARALEASADAVPPGISEIVPAGASA